MCWLNEFAVLPQELEGRINQLQPTEMRDAFAGAENDVEPARTNDRGVAW